LLPRFFATKKTLPVVDAFNRFIGEGSGLGSVAFQEAIATSCVRTKQSPCQLARSPRCAVRGLAGMRGRKQAT
jgi:hypothetical protein